MKRFLLIVAFVLVAAACGEGTSPSATNPPATTSPPIVTSPPSTLPPTTTPPATTPPIDPSARLLLVRLEGGLVPPGVILNRAPLYTLYGDGRLIYEGASPAIWPGPLLPALLQVNIGAAGLGAVLEAIEAVNLPRITELFNSDAISQVVDGPNTVVTYFDETGEHTFSVYSLRIADHKDPQVLLLADLVNLLDQLAVDSPSAGPFEAERFQVLANAQTANPDDPLAVVEPWPLSIAPDEMTELEFAMRCAVIPASDEPTAAQAFQAAHQMTFFEHDGVSYRFTVRPLLSGEVGCRPLDR